MTVCSGIVIGIHRKILKVQESDPIINDEKNYAENGSKYANHYKLEVKQLVRSLQWGC